VLTQCSTFGPVTVLFDERVLVPRPWTLLQSRWAAELAATSSDGPVLELCAGAGQIGLAAAVLADRRLVQVEADPAAAEYAVRNAERAGRSDRVEVRQAPLESAVHADERFPIVLADPPDLPSADLARWPEDPPLAIDGGADGMTVVRSCLRVVADHLTDDGHLLLQVAGDAQAAAVVALLASTPELGLRHRETRRHDPERAVMWIGRPPA
jgi:release factor glutamine methyltransferase